MKKLSLAMVLVAASVLTVITPAFPARAGTDCAANSAKDLASSLHEKKSFYLLDVRNPEEFQESSILGAVNIPLPELEQRLNELPKDKKIYVICRSGRRSGMAVELLKNNGFDKIQNLEGGMQKWNAELTKKKGCV